MTLAVLYIVTFAVFLGIDYLGLSYLIKPTFERDIGALLADSPRIGPAAIFYAFYVGVLLWFVSWPAVQDGKSLFWVLGSGVLIGAMAYGTYEFTNLATLKDWTWRMVATDFIWGSLLTGVSATAGVAVVRATL
ncbi:DUF2177 family protein [Roseovarius sp. Pro17]|uniref:DUF2177 family protein n=1 Tax=Roseovarius sp. Pro17 TaxID=3108175 RepID=UPI002D76B526|nr:DUF2177 family protein [Roseovarius sp. Pro17]